ncbi:type II secretion system major pseudopilin GspG [Pseudomonas soli]|uniref:type II secretion system major pseudopilin GspG n=1 Tax=Pseudomonas soli TaxID=1306993 RepID=UPI00382E69F6
MSYRSTTGFQRARAQGFTLLELLVVLVIIGLLASIVGPRLFGNVTKSELTTAKAQLDILGKAIDQFRLDVGRYPTTQEGTSVLNTPPPGESRWQGPYLKKDVPADPWGVAYQYRYPAERSKADFDLFSFGKDRTPGGTGENADITY